MPATFEIPARIQSRLDRKASPAPRQAEAVAAPIEKDTFDIITDWPAYRLHHPELVFTVRFDLQGRPIWAAEERTR